MPIKLPKTFARRKSSGNALEAIEDSPPPAGASTFRVLSRDDSAKDQSPTGSRPNSSSHQVWPNRNFYDKQEAGNRTSKSTSTAYTSASDRHSYQSTEPSSIESRSQDDLVYQKQQRHPYPPSPEEEEPLFDNDRPRQKNKFSLTGAAGKNFSIPRPRFSKSTSSPPRKDSDVVSGRDRSMTTSSYSSYASTAHPPRVDAGLDMGPKDGSSPSGLWLPTDHWRSPVAEESHLIQPPRPPLPAARSDSSPNLATRKQFSWDEQDGPPPVPLSNRLQHSPAIDRRWQGQHSEDDRQPRPREDYLQDLRPPDARRQSWESNQPEHGFESRRGGPSGLNLQIESDNISRSYSPPAQESPSFHATADQGLLDALAASQALDQEYAVKPAQYLPERPRPGAGTHTGESPLSHRAPPLDVTRSDSFQSSNATTPKARHVMPQHNENLPPLDKGKKRQTYASSNRASILPQGNKIMTKAEFEKYKNSAPSSSVEEEDDKSDEEDDYEDVDEKERHRQLVKQRRKQEAHLAVYRQQMMKVTGEQGSDVPSLSSGRPTNSRSTQSLPSIDFSTPLDPKATEASGKSSEDEDDDVPLGVLQAHGFPSSSRPPTRLTSASDLTGARPMTRMSSYPSPAGATRNDSTAGGGPNTGLPPFARGLPRDPYVGASLVNQPTRQSLGPPGGLVGVIAGEERAKAARRGSPNSNGTYGFAVPQMHQMMPQMAHPGMPFLPAQPSQSELAQIDLNRQMQQMMQMQMQWMQQMQQMMQTPGGMQGMQNMPGMPQMSFPPNMMPMPGDQQQAQPGMQAPNGFLSPMPLDQSQNRDSMLSAASSTNDYQQQQHQRSSSGLSYNPNGSRAPSFMAMPSGGASRYAPSIAPSERSNVGQPSRYRPVTPATPLDNARNSRSTTILSGSALGQDLRNSRSRSPEKLGLSTNVAQGLGAVPNPSTIRAINKPKKGTGGGSDDDEDDAAWQEMRKRREERRSRWTARKKEKENNTELPEGAYFEG